ncbi:ATP-dependent Zn protease [Trichothermofontia sp.]
MPQPVLNLFALTIFGLAMTALWGPIIHLTPFVPATAALTMLGLVAFDAVGLQGQGQGLLRDWIAQRSPTYRQRILYHEAGHFLMAHLLQVPVTGYSLSAWEALRQGQPGQGGIRFDDSLLQAELSQGHLSAHWLNRYTQIWLAGIVAEEVVYGQALGGQDDRQHLATLWQSLQRSSTDRAYQERWAMYQVRQQLQTYRPVLDALVGALERRADVAACQQVIEQAILAIGQGEGYTEECPNGLT